MQYVDSDDLKNGNRGCRGMAIKETPLDNSCTGKKALGVVSEGQCACMQKGQQRTAYIVIWNKDSSVEGSSM